MIPVIDNREALPVRFIEFYTGSNLGPEGTSLLFAHKRGIDWNRTMDKEDKLIAHHLQHGEVITMKRKEWDSIVFAMRSLSKQYKKAGRHFDEWRTAALKLLPVAFVWLSEFDEAYNRAMASGRIIFVDESRDYEPYTGDEDRERRSVVERPYVPKELIGLVFEGFDSQQAQTAQFNLGTIPFLSRPVQEPVPEIEIPSLEEDAKTVKQYPGRLHGEQYQGLTLDEYITHRLQDTPPATIGQIVYELHKELTAIELGRKLQGLGYLQQNGDLKSKVSRMYRKEAERLGTAAEVIKGREN
jgi:hypothetical protein